MANTCDGPALILRWPPLIRGKVVGHGMTGHPIYETTCPDKELWKVSGLGSFDSIRFAKAVFKSPEDKCFLGGPDSLEAIIAMLSEGFVERDFRLYQVTESYLLFKMTKPNAKVTREQYALVDKVKQRFFQGPHIKAARLNVPTSFTVGSVD